MRLENIASLEREQDGRGTTNTYTLIEAPRHEVKQKVGCLLKGHYHLISHGVHVKVFKTEGEVIEHIQKHILK